MDSAIFMILLIQIDLAIDSPYLEHCRPLNEYEEICYKEFIADQYYDWLEELQ